MGKKLFGIGTALLLLMSVAFFVIAVSFKLAPDAQAANCGASSVVLVNPNLTPEQMGNARIIITTAAQLSRTAGLSSADTIKAEVIGVATSYGESGLKNIGFGDAAGPDSRGLFQQRNSWGTLAQRMDPVQATSLFYRPLFTVHGWQQMTVTQAAHAVQRNADPNYYAQFTQMATRFVDQANGGSAANALLSADCASAPAPSGKLQQPPNIGGPGIDGYYTMPPSLNGAIKIYSCQAHRTGSLEQISVLYTVAQRWKSVYPEGWINLGDMNAAGHLSHKWGVAADLEATTNGTDKVADFTHGNYNRAATIELGKMFVDTGKLKNIWYNDVAVDHAVIAYARSKQLPLTQMMPQSGHDNHYHVDVTTPRGPQYEPGC